MFLSPSSNEPGFGIPIAINVAMQRSLHVSDGGHGAIRAISFFPLRPAALDKREIPRLAAAIARPISAADREESAKNGESHSASSAGLFSATSRANWN
jgi:hypothetical protein